MEKTKLSELDIISKKEFKQKALNHKLKYKMNIGLPSNMKFGVETEAISPNFINEMRNKRGVVYFEMPQYKPSNIYEYDDWIITTDESIEKDGGELCSPILSDDKSSWLRLRNMMDYVKKHVPDIKIDDKCASHIHFNGDIFNYDAEALYSFMVLVAETEPVLSRFFSGEYVNLRKMAYQYALSFTNLFLETKIDHSTYFNILNSFYAPDNVGIWYKKYAMDFSRLYLYEDGSSPINTIENRMPNGTLNPTIIQNNIMLTGYLLMSAVNGNYDWQKGLYNILRYNRVHNRIDDNMAFYVADLIPDDDLKLDFLKQYYKDQTVAKNKTLKKSLDFI